MKKKMIVFLAVAMTIMMAIVDPKSSSAWTCGGMLFCDHPHGLSQEYKNPISQSGAQTNYFLSYGLGVYGVSIPAEPRNKYQDVTYQIFRFSPKFEIGKDAEYDVATDLSPEVSAIQFPNGNMAYSVVPVFQIRLGGIQRDPSFFLSFGAGSLYYADKGRNKDKEIIGDIPLLSGIVETGMGVTFPFDVGSFKMVSLEIRYEYINNTTGGIVPLLVSIGF